MDYFHYQHSHKRKSLTLFLLAFSTNNKTLLSVIEHLNRQAVPPVIIYFYFILSFCCSFALQATFF